MNDLIAAPKCPKCRQSPTKVRNTRHTNDGHIVRFRICNSCGWRYRGIGPEWHTLPRADRSPRQPRVQYRLEDVERWEATRDE